MVKRQKGLPFKEPMNTAMCCLLRGKGLRGTDRPLLKNFVRNTSKGKGVKIEVSNTRELAYVITQSQNRT